METAFRIFMFLVPYVLCIAGYIWVGKRAWHAKNMASKIIALAIVGAGSAYMLYKLFGSIGGIMTNDNFEFIIIIVTVFVLFFASIAIALGEPEKN